MKPATFLALCLVFPLQAGGLEDLKAALSRMQSQGTLRGTYEVNVWSRGGKGKEVEEATGTSLAWVEEDAEGLRVRWDRATLKRAEDEVKGPKGAKKPDSPSLGISSTSPLKLFGAMNFAPKLARLLEGSQLKQERVDNYQGKPARVLDLQLTPSDAGDKDFDPKDSTYTAKIWLGSDGVPLAATLSRAMKASKLFISIEMKDTEELVFSPLSNRLVILRREERGTVKTLGIEAQTRTISTFTTK